MPRASLTGTRIRARRIDLGVKQSRLAERCGISASYLNLIEHNRRSIGGKLLVDIAGALDVDPGTLSQGADLALLDALRDAAAGLPSAAAETDRAEELAGRFPGWARLVEAQARRISRLERTAEALNDRLTHDPQLAASLHDVLSAVTAIGSASAILAGEETVDPEWQARFHRNINEDSQRLSQAAQGLVAYLDAGPGDDRGPAAPQEELEAWLDARDWHIADLERSLPPSDAAILRDAGPLTTGSARALAGQYLARYRQDAARMPLSDLREALGGAAPDPAALAQRFATDLSSVFRRLASVPAEVVGGPVGLALCDASGTLTFRKPIDGFPLPRFGAACPLLPLYQALGRPVSPVRARVEQAGRTPRRFLTYAISQPAHPAGFDGPTVFEAAMLILPEDGPEGAVPPLPIGTSCRVCSRTGCAARREPSILGTGEDGA